MKTTKKPMMAKRATKAAPAKKKMMTSAKKPMTVAGKKVQKYQVGGPAMGTMPKGMAGTLGAGAAMGGPRPKPTTTVTPVKTPPKTGGMLQQGGPRGVGGVQPPRFTNYGPGSGQFQNPMPGMPRQGMISNNGGAMIANNPGGMGMQAFLGYPGMGMANPSPGAVQGGTMAQDALAQQLMAQRPQKLPVTRPQQKPGMAQSGFLNQMYPGFQPDPNYQYNPQTSGRSDPQAIAARLAEENNRISAATQQRPGFRKGGAVKKKAPANGRMAKPKGRTAPRGRK